jgi:hypothetical protein
MTAWLHHRSRCIRWLLRCALMPLFRHDPWVPSGGEESDGASSDRGSDTGTCRIAILVCCTVHALARSPREPRDRQTQVAVRRVQCAACPSWIECFETEFKASDAGVRKLSLKLSLSFVARL